MVLGAIWALVAAFAALRLVLAIGRGEPVDIALAVALIVCATALVVLSLRRGRT